MRLFLFHFTLVAGRSPTYVTLFVLTFAITYQIQKSFLLGLFWALLFRCQFSGDSAVLRACVRASKVQQLHIGRSLLI